MTILIKPKLFLYRLTSKMSAKTRRQKPWKHYISNYNNLVWAVLCVSDTVSLSIKGYLRRNMFNLQLLASQVKVISNLEVLKFHTIEHRTYISINNITRLRIRPRINYWITICQKGNTDCRPNNQTQLNLLDYQYFQYMLKQLKRQKNQKIQMEAWSVIIWNTLLIHDFG